MSSLTYTDTCLDPLSTPEICKMILSEHELYPSAPIQEPAAQFIGGLLQDFEDLESNHPMVSPRDVFGYGLESSADSLQNLSQGQGSLNQYQGQYQPYNDNGYSSSSSFPASPESMIVNYEQSQTLNNASFNNVSFSAASPADSHFSSDSAVSFYNMDQPAAVKQEIPDFPAVIEELNQSNSGMQMQYQQYSIVPQQQQQPQPQQQQYQMLEPAYSAYSQPQQQPDFLSQVPTTVANMQQVPNVIYQQQQPIHVHHQQQPQPTNMAILTVPQVVPQAAQPAQPQTVAGRKRSPAGTFASASDSAAAPAAQAQGPSGSKKTRLTKRQKQQLMDKQVDEYTQKNKDLRNQIELLERKVQFCTQFLQKYVSPIVQGRSNTWTPDIVNAVSVEAM